MTDNGNAGPGCSAGRILRQRREVAAIPCVARDPRQDVSFALHYTQRAGEFRFNDHQPFVRNTGINFDLNPDGALTLLLVAGDGIANRVDYALTG